MSELLSGQDLSLLFECCNYFGVKTSRWKFCVATVFGSKLAKPAPRRVLVLQLFSGQDPRLDCKSDFEIPYVSDSVGLELSVADFCLSTAFVRNSFLKDFLQSFASFSHLRWLCSLMSL